MTNIKAKSWKIFEVVFFVAILLFIIVNAYINDDNIIAVISALCGITYTFIAGKGHPICYLFGVTGSVFYCMLAHQNNLWGNLLLYAAYYAPMQVLGFFRWNKNLKMGEKTIVKIKLHKKELGILISLLTIITFFVYVALIFSHDKNPILDSITTVFSIGGMYLTVRRAIEQWIFWMGVNILSLFMWAQVVASGTKAYSTLIMWFVYLILAIYFYFDWKKEIKTN